MGLLNSTQQAYYQGNDFGNYQFVSLKDIINQFMMVYVGEDKIISKAKRLDVAFHAQRGLAELSFDTLKSCKSQEITVPASLQMTLPQDYVKAPAKVEWAYVVINDKPLYNDNISQNFELHPSEETELVYKILKLSGMSMKEMEMVRVGQSLEGSEVQNQKQ